MNFKNNLLSFIYDKNYCICVYENKVFIYNYKELENFSEKEFRIKIMDNDYNISGKNLKVKKITNNELIIEGDLKSITLGVINEKN